jgi:hypothetical protein
MRSYIRSLSLVFLLTACVPVSKHDSVLVDAGEIERKNADKQEQYNVWFQSLTPEQRAREFQRQHERALSP